MSKACRTEESVQLLKHFNVYSRGGFRTLGPAVFWNPNPNPCSSCPLFLIITLQQRGSHWPGLIGAGTYRPCHPSVISYFARRPCRVLDQHLTHLCKYSTIATNATARETPSAICPLLGTETSIHHGLTPKCLLFELNLPAGNPLAVWAWSPRCQHITPSKGRLH